MVADWIKKNQEPFMCCLQKTQLTAKNPNILKEKRWKNVFHAKGNEEKVREAILISDNAEFKTKSRITSHLLKLVIIKISTNT